MHLLKAIKHIMVSVRQNIPTLRGDRDSAEAKWQNVLEQKADWAEQAGKYDFPTLPSPNLFKES